MSAFFTVRVFDTGDSVFSSPIREPMSDAQLKIAVDGVREMMKSMEGPGGPKGEFGAWLDQRARDEARLTAARKRLAESGISQDRLLRFPALQVVLLDEKLSYEILRDDNMKGLMLPYWQAATVSGNLVRTKDPNFLFGADGESLFGPFVPVIIKVKRAQARIDQRLALLRCIEAVRLYAAEHGKPPAKLDDIPLPLPIDPYTGRPFRYEADGMTAHLRGTAPKGEEKTPIYNLHYEVTIKK